jgi:hypothetical protein
MEGYLLFLRRLSKYCFGCLGQKNNWPRFGRKVERKKTYTILTHVFSGWLRKVENS